MHLLTQLTMPQPCAMNPPSPHPSLVLFPQDLDSRTSMCGNVTWMNDLHSGNIRLDLHYARWQHRDAPSHMGTSYSLSVARPVGRRNQIGSHEPYYGIALQRPASHT